MRARRALVDWYLSLFVLCKAWHQYEERLKALALLNSSLVLIDFSHTVNAATLIFISGRGSAFSSVKEGKSGSIYNFSDSIIGSEII